MLVNFAIKHTGMPNSCTSQRNRNRQKLQNQIFIIAAVLRRSVYRVAGSIYAAQRLGNTEISQRWRVAGDTVSSFTGTRTEPTTSCSDSDVFNHYYASWPVITVVCIIMPMLLRSYSIINHLRNTQETQLHLHRTQKHSLFLG